ILTYHDYSPFEFTHQGAFWAEPVRPMGVRWGTRVDEAAMAKDLDKAARLASQHRMPVFVGEFGVYEEVPEAQRARWIGAIRRGMEARGLGWCHWDFATTLKAYDLTTEAWIPSIRAALLD
ncbi:MAG: cellulase family glycosylhydrolase, partial [Pseudomonadota bacterium]